MSANKSFGLSSKKPSYCELSSFFLSACYKRSTNFVMANKSSLRKFYLFSEVSRLEIARGLQEAIT